MLFAGLLWLSLGTHAPAFAETGDSSIRTSQLTSLFGAPAQLTPGESIGDLSQHIMFGIDFEGDLTAENLSLFAESATFSQSEGPNYGSPGSRFVLLLSVANTGTEHGTWQISTKRAGLPELTIAELRNGEIEVLRDRGDDDLGQHLRTYHGIVQPFDLAAGQTRYFVAAFRGVHSSAVPLVIADPEAAIQQQHFKITAIASSVASMLVLMLVATLFYLVTAGRHYLWLAFAELNHAAFVVHVNGYSVHYFLHDKGIWIYAIGWIMPCLYGLAMVQFTRGLLDTSHNLPRLDRLLGWLAILLAATLSLTLTAALASSDWLLGLASYPVPISLTIYTFGLPIVGAIAVARLGKQYIPLLVGWTVMAIFSAYFTIALLDLGLNLPFDAYFYGPVGVVVSLLFTLAMILHMRKVMRDKQQSETELIASLEDRLSLSEEKADALATINDQDQLIHASGHDSQQVMLALNAMIEFTRNNEQTDLPPALTRILEASVNQLQDIADTTMAGPFSTGDSQALVLLGRFELRDLLRQLEMIYRPIAHQKGLTLTIDDGGSIVLLSDRAICARVISNLLNNSIKYTDKGSVQLRISEIDGSLEIALHDTGRGMTKKFSDRLLALEGDRLRADIEVDGSGSGFAAANRAVQKLGGGISIDSSMGKGTCVTMTLPAVSSAPECSLETFAGEARVQGLEILDFDASDASKTANSIPLLPISAHPTAAARNRISQFADIALLKPVSPDMLKHPLILALIDNKSAMPLERV